MKTKPTKIYFVSPGKKPSTREEEKLQEDLRELFSIISDAWNSYEIWLILIHKNNRGNYFQSLFHFKNFFEPCAFAHINMLIVDLYKLYDRKNLSLPKILKDAQTIGILSRSEVEKMDRKIKEAKLIWSKITILRSNLFAHRSCKLTKSAIYKKAKIKPNHIKRLIELSVKIFNMVYVKVHKRRRNLDDGTRQYTHKLLQLINKNLQ